MRALTSVLIVEPSDIICEGLRSLLNEAGGFNVLAPMHDASMLEERLPVVRPDLMIINPTLLSSTPRQQLSSIGRQRPEMAVAALVYQYVESSVRDLFKYTVDIRSSRSEVVAALNGALKASSVGAEAAEMEESYELSERETDVLVLVAKGMSSKEIASKLNISVHTVNTHRKNITHKTGIKSVAGLAVYAMIHNLME